MEKNRRFVVDEESPPAHINYHVSIKAYQDLVFEEVGGAGVNFQCSSARGQKSSITTLSYTGPENAGMELLKATVHA